MNKILLNIAVLFLIASVSGCASTRTNFQTIPTHTGAIFTNNSGPLIATSNDQKGSLKKGVTSAQGILALVAWGDASVETAVKLSGITKIHHIDYDHLRIVIPIPFNQSYTLIRIYEKFTTNVYGE